MDAWSRLRCGLLLSYEGRVPYFGSGKASKPSNFSAWLIRKGHVRIGVEGQEPLVVSEGFWAFPPVDRPRSQLFSEGAEILSIGFQMEWAGSRNPFPLDRTVFFKSATHPHLERAAFNLAKATKGFMDFPLNPSASGAPDLAVWTRIQGRFWLWLELFVAALAEEGVAPARPSDVDPRLPPLMRILDGMPFPGGAPYAPLERSAGLGRVQIDRLFKKELGVSPRGYMERLALDEAKARLLYGSLSVKELASSLGFSGPSPFCSWFKRRTGHYPSEFKSLPR